LHSAEKFLDEGLILLYNAISTNLRDAFTISTGMIKKTAFIPKWDERCHVRGATQLRQAKVKKNP